MSDILTRLVNTGSGNGKENITKSQNVLSEHIKSYNNLSEILTKFLDTSRAGSSHFLNTVQANVSFEPLTPQEDMGSGVFLHKSFVNCVLIKVFEAIRRLQNNLNSNI